jgi:hypothetical protein
MRSILGARANGRGERRRGEEEKGRVEEGRDLALSVPE